MKNLIKVAKINANDEVNGEVIFFLVDENFKITSSNGDEVTYGDVPESAAEVFEIIHGQWGMWETLEYMAEYDEETNKITEN